MTVPVQDGLGERAMGKREHTNRFENDRVHGKGKPIREFLGQAGFELILPLFISAGTVISGILVLPASIGIGLCLILLGTAVFSEV